MQWISLIPPLVTLILAIYSKRIIPSLALGLLIGSMLVSSSLLGGIMKAGDYIIGSFASEDNAYIILFLFLLGALAEIFKVSGGIKGFSLLAGKYVTTEKGALLSVWAVTPVTFLDCCFHVIAAGTVSKPLIEKVKGSKERLAAVINITSSQLIVLIPIATTYVGYILGVTASAMEQAGIKASPCGLYLKSIPFNFYSIGMVLLSILLAFFNLNFGKWRFGKKTDLKNGVHSEHEAHEQCEFEERAQPRVSNLLVPLLVLIGLIVFLFWFTGNQGNSTFLEAFMNAQFEKAIFIASFATLIITVIFYSFRKIPLGEMESHFLTGGTDLLPPIVILVLSWSLSSVTKDLGFIDFVTNTVGTTVPAYLIPSVVFLIGAFTSYFIGSSWATWALMMPLGLQLAVSTGASLPVVTGAVLAGGSVGDNVSPLGETPVLTAAISEVSVLDHVQSILPYASIIIGISAVLYMLIQAIVV